MALPKAYLTSTKNLPAILQAIQQAKAPERFTIRFLEALEFKGTADRLVIGVLKSLGFLDDQGKPTSRYFGFLDQTQSGAVLAEAVREAYADLFQVNTSAQRLSKADVVNKFKTLSQGQYGESVLDKMASTFTALVKLADFSPQSPKVEHYRQTEEQSFDNPAEEDDVLVATIKQTAVKPTERAVARSLGGLHYNIQIILPESRDPAVYDALFRSLREHLI